MWPDYSQPMADQSQGAIGHPDLQLPEPDRKHGLISIQVGVDVDLVGLLTILRDTGAEIVAINTFPAPRGASGVARVFDFETRGLDGAEAAALVKDVPGVIHVDERPTMGQIFGKRVIVIGGGAQVAQVTLGAVSEADRHNLRGERISVDTIPLVGEANIAAAVRAVADLPRARLLVLAGSIMGGEITRAAHELRAVGIPIIALNMVGSITDAVDLVVSDPVQAGTMAVMAIADTATFDLARQRGRRY